MKNIEVLKKWMFYKCKDLKLNIKIIKQGLEIKEDHKVAQILIWDNGFIEEVIKEDNAITFYLYYYFNNYLQAKMMFHAFIKHLNTHNHKIKKVLLCCSGGMTTSYFKNKMNTFLKLNGEHMIINAAASSDIPYIYQDYDIILVAPQMKYALNKIKINAPTCIVESISPRIFATYDCNKLYHQIEKYYER